MNAQAVRKSVGEGLGAHHRNERPGDYASTDEVEALQKAEDCPPVLAIVTLCRIPTAAEITELVEHHLTLVGVLVSERLRNVPNHIRRDDLMSAGMMALVLSAGAYDPQRGFPFRSFATYRIRGALIDELRSMDWASRSVRSRAREVETVRAQLASMLDRMPGSDDIADALGISVRNLDALYADLARGTVLSLQGFATDALPDTPANHADCPETLILYREQMGYLHDAIAALPERLRMVVVAYYFGHRQMSDIAVDMSVTQSRVSQMCTEATTLMRDGMNSQLDPDALPPLAQTGRAATARTAYYRAIADRSTVGGRLEMSTLQGEMRHGVHINTKDVEKSQRVRIA